MLLLGSTKPLFVRILELACVVVPGSLVIVSLRVDSEILYKMVPVNLMLYEDMFWRDHFWIFPESTNDIRTCF